MQLDLAGRQTVHAHRPTVITKTGFIEAQFGGKIRMIEPLADDASDETLAAARTPEELEAAIRDLPRPGQPAQKFHPLDRDRDGEIGGSPKGEESSAAIGARRKRAKQNKN